ncbi:MAG TPA: TIGR01440 family protein [Clostridia bacterium]|nr:TIGR01440 family protein [Clostridia bacterium]
MFDQITKEAAQAVTELTDIARLQPGALLVIGCSSSEMVGQRIGKGSSMEAARAVWRGIAPILAEREVHLAAQCCEHLNRALVVERAVALRHGYEIVNAVPRPDAGGSFPVTVYENMEDPVLVDAVRADAGLDIGGTLIGMHLKQVAVPVRLGISAIGQARILCARTRPRYIGGPRAAHLEM